jgi:hypothetical protein
MYIGEGLRTVNGGAGNCSQGQRSETFMCNHLDAGAESHEQWQLI